MAINKKETIKVERLSEEYLRIEHSTGLTLLLYPMQGFSGAYALFSTKYGSVDTCFKTDADNDFVTLPEGVAHFLEHKLFESEEGDAFELYAKTGANANAFTSFDRTAYLFSCTEQFEQSIDILLNFVTKPYFTEQTVAKEQGIIGQEIKMYEDMPDWRVFFNLLGALYHNHPVRQDIAGTVESIAQINAELLMRCYKTFYNLHNMVLTVAGNFSVDAVLEAADRILQPAQPLTIERKTVFEPRTVRETLVEQILPVAQPLFHVGFKGDPGTERENVLGQILDELVMDILIGEASPLYRELYDAGLINQTFSTEAMTGRDYTLTIFSGESRDPKAVYERLGQAVREALQSGLDADAFRRCKKALYGKYLGMYGRVESVAGLMLTAHFYGLSLCEMLDTVVGFTLEQANARLRSHFDVQRSALSVVRS